MKSFEKVLRNWKIILIIFFISADGLIFYMLWREYPTDFVKVAFMDVGQGDAIYIESPWHERVIVDGGPNTSILGELSKLLPFYERKIDTLIVTNPDADHYSGFLNILDTYSVNRVIEPGTKSDTERYKTLEDKIKEKEIERVIAKQGMILHLGDGVDLKFLFPDRDVSGTKINEGSIVAKLEYGSSTVMLMGDAPKSVEKYLVAKKINLESDILKIGHHGSKTSTDGSFVKAVNPKYAVISAGCKNKYGHPNQETLDTLEKEKVEVFSTCKEGSIVFKLNLKSIQPF